MNPVISVGDCYARLTVQSLHSKRGDKWWLCLCDCGRKTVVRQAHLRSGRTRSCGCLKRETDAKRFLTHGRSETPEFRVWGAMLERCYSPNHISYPLYGGRGIRVCHQWRRSFEQFMRDMGPRPSWGSLERIDNHSDYSPDNCRWATAFEQANNKRNNRLIEFQGRALTARAWARLLGVPPKRIEKRIRAGWTADKALTQPPKVTKSASTATQR